MKKLVLPLEKFNPNQHSAITITTYNHCGEYLITGLHGERTINDIEYLELDNGASVYSQSITLYPTDGDFKNALLQTLNNTLGNLGNCIANRGADDDYYDYLPAYIEQIYQFIQLISYTEYFSELEIGEFLQQLEQHISNLNDGEDNAVEPGLTPDFLCKDYLEDSRLHYIGFTA